MGEAAKSNFCAGTRAGLTIATSAESPLLTFLLCCIRVAKFTWILIWRRRLSLPCQIKQSIERQWPQTLWTADERTQLSNSNLDRNVAMKIVTEIANRVSLNIAKMNGKDAADPRQRSYYLGVANNLEKLNWKKPTT
jgi:hypothetical protein